MSEKIKDMKANIVRLLSENTELKRERDEAREQCRKWLEEWHLTDKLRRDTKAERDEAMEQNAKLRAELDQLMESVK